ncbi:3-phosphoshikimate 1-carboxyvinyltransferase [Campylobacter pinnipediorum subsp. caledonicus]|uniref:3-phosphoshikimate 1-carboxyvinyltransferase n=1 Tax=Campylobacter pinnipediorum TaxID=1965231 RepID=UPI00099538B1|nr:3-phosphoshikimate 1-carboxyvinyltransferase [Campylobacter pinnipediorum]AQW85992.1 3-phosphoshikimate 1-carboxyvinyltransferase [Campylobacter pinnipediorum subsp. caledonicus]
MIIKPLKKPINIVLEDVSADKSISHRTAIFSLLSDKDSKIRGYLKAQDTLNTLNIIKQLGAVVKEVDNEIVITPPQHIKEPNAILDCGNSGTAMRILMGFLVSQNGFYVLSGDRYLNERPMSRVGAPLLKVGAKIDGRNNGDKAPICIRGSKLDFFKFESQISSAQIKSALILAGLCSNGCEFYEDELSRDHSEKMLLGMGASIMVDGLRIFVNPMEKPLEPLDIDIPNDPSSAFFYAVAACIVPNSHLIIKNIILNKTRIEAYNVLKKMGADITFKKISSRYEDIGEIEIKYAPLKSVDVNEKISWLIDEIPALAIAFCFADGKSSIRNAKELRVKESDRIHAMVVGLRQCGIEVQEFEDGFSVIGGEVKSSVIDSYGDHRIAMSFAILGLICGMQIKKSEFIKTSFPNFSNILRKIGAYIED